MENKKEKGKFEKALDWVCTPKFLIILSLIIIVISLISPLIFTRPHFFENIVFNDKTGVIGDTFGIMNPIIAIAAAIITFAAFWTQYQANTEMLKENRTERDESFKLNKKQQLINQFYEMLKIHQDNVKELKWTTKVLYEKKEDANRNPQKKFSGTYVPSIAERQAAQEKRQSEDEYEFVTDSGRYIFNYYLNEFNIAFNLVDIIHPEKDPCQKVKIAYDIFYKGYCEGVLNDLIYTARKSVREKHSYAEYSKAISDVLVRYKLAAKSEKIQSVLLDVFQRKSFFTIQSLLCGHFEKLNHYYRHLFLMVKTIAKESEDILPYREKRDLLRILRAQLSNKEQIMLFYNWFSGHGKQWEEFGDEGNHFFTRFRMIHNMTPYDVIPFQSMDGNSDTAIINFIQYFSCQATSADDFKDHPIFDSKYAEKEYPEKTNDPLFEFEDWYDAEDHKFKYGN